MATIPGKSDNLNSTRWISHTHTHTHTQDQIDGLEDINQLLLSQTTLAQSEVSVTIVTKYHSNHILMYVKFQSVAIASLLSYSIIMY